MNNKNKWSKESLLTAKTLHSKLTLNHENWHNLKGKPEVRAAELLSSAILQILQGGQKDDINALINQASQWLKGEVKDPGCPRN